MTNTEYEAMKAAREEILNTAEANSAPLTYQLLGAVYNRNNKAADKAPVTHSYVGGALYTVCGKISGEKVADAYAHTAEELTARPTCKACAKKF